MLSRIVALPHPLDLGHTLGALRHGGGDPATRFAADGVWLALQTELGASTLHLEHLGETVSAEAWGPGAEQLLEEAPTLMGHDDDPSALVPHHDIVAEAQRRFPGARLARTNRLFEALVPGILGQKITTSEAFRVYRRLVHTYGDDAPGPVALKTFPRPEVLAQLAYHDFHPLGLERRRAQTVIALARKMPRLSHMHRTEVDRFLQAFPGIGPWTTGIAYRVAFGDPDAVALGDFHIPNMVAWNLAGEDRADDARMLELLEPYVGQRGRAVGYIKSMGRSAPRRGPRMAARNISRW